LKKHIQRRIKILTHIQECERFVSVEELRKLVGGKVLRQTIQQDLAKLIEQRPEAWVVKKMGVRRGGSYKGYLCNDFDFEYDEKIKSKEFDKEKKFESCAGLDAWLLRGVVSRGR